MYAYVSSTREKRKSIYVHGYSNSQFIMHIVPRVALRSLTFIIFNINNSREREGM